jgi:hypothetical protein
MRRREQQETTINTMTVVARMIKKNTLMAPVPLRQSIHRLDVETFYLSKVYLMSSEFILFFVVSSIPCIVTLNTRIGYHYFLDTICPVTAIIYTMRGRIHSSVPLPSALQP